VTRHRPQGGVATAEAHGRPAMRRLLAAALAMTAAAIAAGCSGPPAAETRPAAAVHPPAPGPRAAGAPARPATAEPALSALAAHYLQARENAISYTHPTPRDWLREVWPAMTPTGWARLSASLGDRGGFPAAAARAHRWSVQATVACRHDPEAPPATGAQVTVVCAVTDRTVDVAGIPVAAKELPGLWPYTRPQQPALLVLRRDGGRWLVDDDETGRAG